MQVGGSRHAVLGAGGVGGFIGALLAEAGQPVTLLLRPETRVVHPERLSLASPFGDRAPRVQRSTRLETAVDVLWVTVKSHQLSRALDCVPDPALAGLVVPLLNGIDHLDVLRERLGAERVVAATIRIEAERVAAGSIVHHSPFAVIRYAAWAEAALAPAMAALRAAGCDCQAADDEITLMWRKLVLLAPLALCTTAANAPVGDVLLSQEWRATLEGSVREACAVATAWGAEVSADDAIRIVSGMPPGMRSSMQKDVAAGREPELDAIAGPILRGGDRHGIPVPTTRGLAAAVARRRQGIGATSA